MAHFVRAQKKKAAVKPPDSGYAARYGSFVAVTLTA